MSNNSIEKRQSTSIKEKGQYAVGFGVIALMLYVVGFPVFMLVFFGALAFFVWKVFVAESRGETRRIFEFYLAANEILRDDERRWFGFEINEAISRGEAVVRGITPAPPLVHFALGALYQRIEDHSSAVRHLAAVVEESLSDESAIMFPTKGLREYVRMLRRIERAPAESPQTSAAIRSLERSRKNRGSGLLAHSRDILAGGVLALTDRPVMESRYIGTDEAHDARNINWKDDLAELHTDTIADTHAADQKPFTRAASSDERKTISEVLHDIYDEKVQ